MSNNKQSSVEYYAEQLQILGDEVFKIGLTLDEFRIKKHELLEQAKAMHKEEHSNTWDESVDNYKKRGENDMRHWVDFDDYYNETFGGNNGKTMDN